MNGALRAESSSLTAQDSYIIKLSTLAIASSSTMRHVLLFVAGGTFYKLCTTLSHTFLSSGSHLFVQCKLSRGVVSDQRCRGHAKRQLEIDLEEG